MAFTVYYETICVLGIGIVLAVIVLRKLFPAFSPELLLEGWSKKRYLTLLLIFTAGIAVFIFFYGNQQFGGFDQSIIVETQWRFLQQQKPYTDFYCTLPPGFILGLKYSNYLSLPLWDAQLALQAIFAGVTFLWSYFLLGKLLRSRLTALLTALCVQSCSNLFVSYWWYNPITSVSGGLFFLSCLVFVADGRRWSQLSVVLSFILLGLMKPNGSAPLLLGAIVVFAVTRYRPSRFLLLSFVSSTLLWIFLSINSLPPLAILSSFREISRSRGLYSPQGLLDWSNHEIIFAFFVCVILLIPFAASGPRGWKRRLESSKSSACKALLILLAPVVAGIAMLTNGEFKFVDMVLVILPSAVLTFGGRVNESSGLVSNKRLALYYATMLYALLGITLYSGAIRVRVRKIGPFYQDRADQVAGPPIFPHLLVGDWMKAVLREVRATVPRGGAQRIFFGPRIEFCYSMFRLPSPSTLPIWWHPGTSYPVSREGEMIRKWQDCNFDTLIFLKNEYVYYPSALLRLINRRYTRDESRPNITVFRRIVQ